MAYQVESPGLFGSHSNAAMATTNCTAIHNVVGLSRFIAGLSRLLNPPFATIGTIPAVRKPLVPNDLHQVSEKSRTVKRTRPTRRMGIAGQRGRL